MGKYRKSSIYSCEQCNKKLGTRGYSVECTTCENWFHRTCTDLSVKQCKELKRDIGWKCNRCSVSDQQTILQKENKNEKSYNEQEIEEAALDDTDNINEDLLQLNQELRNELESVNLIVTDMGKQLEVSRCAEKNLRKQITSLETLLIEREEFIIKLQNDRKQKESINVNNASDLYSTIVKVQTKNKDVRRSLPLLKPEQPIVCKNKFQALSESEVEESTSEIKGSQATMTGILEKYNQPTNSRSTKTKKPRLLFVADSHGKHMSPLLEEELGESFTVEVVTNPGANFNYVAQNLVEMTSNFTAEDHAIFLCGSNDCDRVKDHELLFKP
ncbi:hypothetical protein J6590_096012 [Homalodisca vitripennis]|nr:hypothetical protein J6590_096012 [Homalodisca vitripennis]